jgi:hypothetical protein
VAGYQLAVEAKRGTAGGEAQHKGAGAAVGVDGGYNLVGHVLHALVFGIEDVCGDFLVAAYDVAGYSSGNEATVFGKCVLAFHLVCIFFKVVSICFSKLRKKMCIWVVVCPVFLKKNMYNASIAVFGASGKLFLVSYLCNYWARPRC